MIDLAVLSRVKTLCEIDADNDDYDDVIGNIISAVSQKIENHIGRKIETTSRTEYFNVHKGDFLFPVKAYPVTTLTSVHNDSDWDYGSSTAVSTDYSHMDNDTGCLYVTGGVLVMGFRALRVIYTGGMATCTEELLDNWADVAQAAEKQTVYEYKTRTKIGAQSVSAGGGGNVSWETGGGLLKEVKEILKPYRRMN